MGRLVEGGNFGQKKTKRNKTRRRKLSPILHFITHHHGCRDHQKGGKGAMPLLPYHDNDPNHTLLGDTLEDDPHRIHPKEAISLFSEGDHENRGLDPLV